MGIADGQDEEADAHGQHQEIKHESTPELDDRLQRLAHHRLIAVKLAIPAGIKVREARPTVLIRIS